MTVSVRLFAMLRERAGRERVELSSPRARPSPTRSPRSSRLPVARATCSRGCPCSWPSTASTRRAATPLAAADELALIPPLSGGAPEDGDRSPAQAAERRRACTPPSARARSTSRRCRRSSPIRAPARSSAFSGVTREVTQLDYEAYEEMATRADRADRARVRQREHGLCAIAVEHRVGSVALGEPSVIVAVSAPHREEAFAGARDAIDRIKAEAPIWKVEVDAERLARGASPARRRPARSSPAPRSPSSRPARSGSAARERAAADAPRRARAARGWSTSARRTRASASRERERACACRRRRRAAVERGDAPKGEVLATARLAGIRRPSRPGLLIPLAHPITPTLIDVARERRRRAGRRRAAQRGARGRPHGRRDGGDDRVRGRRADRLRHGQGARARRRDRARRAAREDRRAQRLAPRRGR